MRSKTVKTLAVKFAESEESKLQLAALSASADLKHFARENIMVLKKRNENV